MNEQVQSKNKLDFFKRFYNPKEMFYKRKYKWWQNTIFLILFAVIGTVGAYIYLANPNYYRKAITSSLTYYTDKTKDPEFQKSVASAEFEDGKLIYHGTKRIRKNQKFDLGINLTQKEMEKEKPRAGIVFNRKHIVLYARNAESKKYTLGRVDFPYSSNFNNKNSNLKKEIEKSWFAANTKAYLQSIWVTWIFGFIFRILLVWMIFILVLRSIITGVNKKEESMVNLFGFLSNATLIPILIMAIFSSFAFNSLTSIAVFVVALLVIVIITWVQTRFSDEPVKIKGKK
ncbi:hypothetical protein [Xylocopilactobacillus apis]|uniref:DUF1189 domain-containing protein n=1 Tax=Xylocopilactobacillus apis TaxID=2932183 RepID=A0AAU9CWH3_9LACO|nr:hypothetical protein [Xylocopilactobacillus apis]BDR55633.1 hypothetical protein KIMC2_01950 [Xylocopilactobacillus apis]